MLVVYELRVGGPGEAGRAEVRRLVRAELDLAAAAAPEAGLGARTGLERDAVRASMPTWLAQMVTAERGLDAGLALLEAMNNRAPMAIRVNTALTTPEALTKELAEEGVVRAVFT